MSEAVVAAFVGGMIALLGSSLGFLFEYRKWRKQLRLERLRNKRDKYEVIFSKVYTSLVTSCEQCLAAEGHVHILPIDVLSDVYCLCPEQVRDVIHDHSTLDPTNTKAITGNLAVISIKMKDYLAELDAQIDQELGCKSRPWAVPKQS